MKPKTKIQKRVAELNAKMKPISNKAELYAFEKCFEKIALSNGKGKHTHYTCGECGCSWEEADNQLANSLLGVRCPECSKNLKIVFLKNKRVIKESCVFAIVTTSAEFQVFRYFNVFREIRKGDNSKYRIIEVMRQWFDTKGHTEVTALKFKSFHYYKDMWVYDGDISLRDKKNNVYGFNRYDLRADEYYCVRRILPTLKRNGFDGDLHCQFAMDIIPALLTNPKIETLWKAGMFNLVGIADKYWSELKIVIRNNYSILSVSTWTDYIDTLKQFGKDTLNAYYTCPSDLNAAHDKWLKKKKAQKEKKEFEQRLKEIQTEELEYQKRIQRYIGIAITSDDMIIRPLQSVLEMYKEGQAMHHCVYLNEYYKKKNCLIMSVRDNYDRRLATVEFNTRKNEIVQIRGIQNALPEKYDYIKKVINQNINVLTRKKL